MTGKINNVAVIGTGVIGTGWIIRFLTNKKKVWVYDVDRKKMMSLKKDIKKTLPHINKLFKKNIKKIENLHLVNSIEDAVKNADLIQENVPEQNIVKEEVQDKTEIHQENISLESATYMENNQQNEKLHDNESDIPNFEVDSIELATPELYSQDQEEAFSKEEELKVFDNEETTEESSVIKEPEMFDESESEEDLEIPAFLRKQKNLMESK